MTLKYSDDEIKDEELRGIYLQTAACQSDAPQKTTPILFQKALSPQKQVPLSDHYIPDGQNTPNESSCP